MLNKKGYTIVEGIIAMLLVAVMVGGIFSALMASRRAIVEPSRKEEMLYAIESLENDLKNCVSTQLSDDCVIDGCGDNPLNLGTHYCKPRIPAVCKNPQPEDFSYTVTTLAVPVTGTSLVSNLNQIKISLKCNGEAL